jgi:hypothetical protein
MFSSIVKVWLYNTRATKAIINAQKKHMCVKILSLCQFNLPLQKSKCLNTKIKATRLLSSKKNHLSQIFHHYKSHFINQLFKKLKDFFKSFLFNIVNKHFTKHKSRTFNLQKQKWMFNLQEQEQELSTFKNKNKNFQHWRTRTRTFNFFKLKKKLVTTFQLHF